MQLNPSINTLIFDFGNVIIDIDFQLTWNAFEQLIGDKFSSIFLKWKEDGLYANFERGTYTADEMTEIINQNYQLNLKSNEVKEAWNALLLTIPKERIELLQELKKDYNLYLLSNTNFLHIESIFNSLEEDYELNPIKSIFEKLYLSYEIGAIKPEPEIYEYVLNDLNIKGEQCIFFDDLQENLNGAAKFGIHTQLVTKEKGILELFKRK